MQPGGSVVTTSSPNLPSTSAPALDDDGTGFRDLGLPRQTSPALSTASTADGDLDDFLSSPVLPSLPAPKLSQKAASLLKSPPPVAGAGSGTVAATASSGDSSPFGTASWGSPYPKEDENLRNRRTQDDGSDHDLSDDDTPIHQLGLDTRFLRPAPGDESFVVDESKPALSAAAAVLANRVRRYNAGLKEEWIRAHTAGDTNAEPRLWFSDGSDSEHSSVSGSDLAWIDDKGLQTPRNSSNRSRSASRHPRGRSSVETLKPGHFQRIKLGNQPSMSADAESPANAAPITTAQAGSAAATTTAHHPNGTSKNMAADTPLEELAVARPKTPTDNNARKSPADVALPATPKIHKPLPRDPPITPRVTKKVPWKGKKINILIPRDEDRGKPGKTPRPLRPDEVDRMFRDWKEFGYSVDGFDLLVDGFHPAGTDDSQSRADWPSPEDMARERGAGKYTVLLPDLNAWANYVSELQEAKLRSLGVFTADEEPTPSISPITTDASRIPSGQYPALPFSPPLPTSSASSNHALAGFPFQTQFLPGGISASQSPGIPAGASPIPFGMPGKFNPRQSISLPASGSPFQVWPNQAAMMQGMNRIDSPGLMNLNGMISPAPYGIEGFQQVASPGLNAHQRRQSLQYVNPQQLSAPSPHLEKVQEAEDEGQADSKSASKTPEPLNKSRKQAHLDPQSAEYHLEEQFRNQLDHDDYNPHNAQASHSRHETLASLHERQASGNLQVSEHFANDQAQPVVLHHPRPHSRGQSLTQNFFRDGADGSAPNAFEPLNQIPESKVDASEQYEIETNPSNLGTPVQDFNFAAVLAPPQRATSTGSNPWQDSSMSNGNRKSSGGKPTFSKLNVKAPEFKFNPTSNFTPGAFSFSGASASFEPAIFTGSNTHVPQHEEPEPESDLELVPAPVSHFGTSFTNFNAAIPSFTPGNSTFSFSTSGPKFRPDAPSFTPFQSLGSDGGFQSRRTDSIFGNIVIDPELLQQPMRASKAIPIMKPSEASPAIPEEDDAMYDGDGRLTNETRAKRARSTAPTDADLLLASPIHEYESDSANIITSAPPAQDKDSEADKPIQSTETVAARDVLPEETITPRTSLSSKLWNALLNRSTDKPALRRNDSIEMEKSQGHKHRRSLSASAPVFTPGATAYGSPVADSKGNETPTSPLKQIHSPAEEATTQEPAVEEKSQPAVDKPEPVLSASTTSKPTPDASDAGRASPKPKRKGLAASRFAKEAPVVEPATPVSNAEDSMLLPSSTGPLVDLADSKATIAAEPEAADVDGEPTLEEIDAIMQHMKTDPSKGVNKAMAAAPAPVNPSPTKFPPSLEHIKSKLSATAVEFTPSARSSGHFHSPNLEDPFVDFGSHNQQQQYQHQQQTVFSQIDHFAPLQHAAFGHSTHATEDYTQHVEPFAETKDYGMDDGLASRLESMEKMLATLQHSLTSRSRRGASSRRDRDTRSLSGRESDADDEDDEQPNAQRSASPRKDRKMEQIRFAVMEALAAHPREVAPAAPTATNEHSEAVMSALEDIKSRLLTTSASAIGRSSEDGSRSLDADTPHLGSDVDMIKKMDELHNKVGDLDQKLYYEQTRVEEQIKQRRAAEEAAEELTKKLHAAETRVEVEIINKSAYDSRVADLEERLRQMEEKSEEEANMRRSTEERLAQSQSQLKVASEEEARLREVVEKKEQKIRELEQHSGKKATRMAVLEAAHNTATQSKSDLANKLNVLETDLREVRQDNANLRTEVERSDDKARNSAADLATALEDNKRLQQSLVSIQVQLEENERLRESWRGKHETLQQTMADAARDIAEETARRIKKDEATLARQQQLDAHQEVLDARLQAEAKTRERLEVEMERLQTNERSGIRAVKECQRLETLLVEMRNDNHKLHQLAAQSKRESEEAREGGSLILERTKTIMQIEMEGLRRQLQEHVHKHHGVVEEHKIQIAAHQTEIESYKAEIESHKAAVENHRAEVESHKTRADGVRERSASMLETAAASRQQETDELKLAHASVIDDLKLAQSTIVEDLKASHATALDDLKTQHERQLANAIEDGQRTEQALSERLGLSAEKLDHLTDKVAHLQDRNDHLEEKLSVAKQAAAAAAAAAKNAGVDTRALAPVAANASVASPAAPVNKQLELPEKISPQALRESIMVLQEQLQAREQRIEELEQTVSNLDPEAPAKITKRDDEITWLRELLAVRHGDLQDIITALSTEQFDRERVKDASIRLKANLQMEEQERERAMNGGSAISLPNIASSLQAATPRVAQAVGSGLNAWDRWRKSSQPFLSGVLSSPSGSVQSSGTPSRSKSSSFNLLTPPASGRAQPTAFSSTGRRYPSQKLAVSRVRADAPEASSSTPEAVAESEETESTEIDAAEAQAPSTPPMTVQSGYDSDAQPGDFDENDFFEN